LNSKKKRNMQKLGMLRFFCFIKYIMEKIVVEK
jgi:hypothetical protein